MIFVRQRLVGRSPLSLYQQEVSTKFVGLARAQTCCLCAFCPVVECRTDISKQFLPPRHAKSISFRQQVRPSNFIKLPVDAHRMLVGPFPSWVVGVRYVVCGGQFPTLAVP